MDGAFLTNTGDLHARVVGILAAQALREPSGLTAEMSLDSLGIDSLGMAEILFAIEETFDVTVPFNANDTEGAGLDLRTVGAVCMAVEALVRDQRG
ncbi:MAG: acyl carrier protein [Rhodobacter sp.]|nr:acyl carrier protein [Paracoccaceae bacterium]MCC0075840.1 acyl carrier protein [Rhodobacter sp.]